MALTPLVLLYDADCGFCTRSVDAGRRLGCAYDATPYQSWPHLAEHGITSEAAGEALHAVRFDQGRGDQVLIGHEAVAAALETSTRSVVRLVGRVLASRPVRPLGAWSYAFVARHRHQLPGGTAVCKIEEPR